MRIFNGADELRAAAGEQLGTTDWTVIDQEQINGFADATHDHQWIHVDTAKAAAGPFGTTIAHGFLTLSLVPHLAAQLYRIEGVRMGINYGLDRVRFPAPVPVGSKLRASCELVEVTEVCGGVQCRVRTTLEVEGGDKPACVAEMLSRLYF